MGKQEKQARLSATTAKFTTMFKHPRSSSRPVIAKGSKSDRLRREELTAAIKDAQRQIAEVVTRVKRYEKLLKRQTGPAAARTQEQVNELRTEISMLQERARSAAEDAANIEAGDMKDAEKSELAE